LVTTPAPAFNQSTNEPDVKEGSVADATTTENVALDPSPTLSLWGCVTIAGADCDLPVNIHDRTPAQTRETLNKTEMLFEKQTACCSDR